MWSRTVPPSAPGSGLAAAARPSNAVSACTLGKQWQRAFALSLELSKQGSLAKATPCNAAVSACRLDRQWQRAPVLFLERSKQGLLANVITYNAAVSACGLAGRGCAP